MKGGGMTRAKTKARAQPGEPDTTLNLDYEPGKSDPRRLAELGISPVGNAMIVAKTFASGSFGKLPVTDLYQAMAADVAKAERGDLSVQREMLAAQSFALNSIFTEMTRRAALNMGEYIGASETYMRLALKAQAQSRQAIEALDRMANGREQTVRHIHVDNRGGQAVIADTVQTGGRDNDKADKQPHALESRSDTAGQPLRSTHTLRKAVPIPGDA